MTAEPTRLTSRYVEAVAYATAIHATQARKGTRVPYVAHLLGVSGLVLEAGGSEDEAIAGLLHDAVEDCGGLPRLADIRARFGDRVADIVLGCSDSTDDEWKRRVDYETRKQSYVEHLATDTDDGVLRVSLADKVHNARAIATDLQRDGIETLGRFNGSAEQILRYYRSCLQIGVDRVASDRLLWPLRSAVAVLAEHIEGTES